MRYLVRSRRTLATLATILLVGAAAPLDAQATTPERVSHAAFDGLLRQHVRGGLVDYDAFAASPAFAKYLQTLARTDPSRLPRTEQLAFWINAYNAYTIQLINNHEERASIKNINRALGFIKAGGPWKEPMATVGGTDYTLDEIEHERIRPVFNEPRIHFALVCAAISCPPLRSEAYVAERLDAQFEAQATQFLRRSPGKNRVDVASGTVYLSRIFDWYGQDFAPSSKGVLTVLSRYWPAGPERALLASGRARVKWTEYDWSLNLQQ